MLTRFAPSTRPGRPARLLAAAAIATLAAQLHAQAPASPAADPAGWFPFAPKNNYAPGAIGMQDWLEKTAGKRGPVRIKDDHFVLGDGTPIKFWGTNLGNLENAPPPAAGREWADRFAKYGVNCVRLHKFVPDIMVKESSTRFDAERLGNFDQFTKELRDRGMYYGFSWIFGHKVRPDDKPKLRHYDEIVAGGGETSRVLIFIADDVQDLRIEMLTNLLTHKNPLTGLAYAKDPALAFVEFQNEDSIFFYTFSGYNDLKKFPSYKAEFNKKFSDWLRARYKSHDGLVKAWGEKALNIYEIKDEHLDRGNIMVQGSPWNFSPDGLKVAGANLRRVLDTARFLYDTQTALYAKFEKVIRAAGYEGPLVSSPARGPRPPACHVTSTSKPTPASALSTATSTSADSAAGNRAPARSTLAANSTPPAPGCSPKASSKPPTARSRSRNGTPCFPTSGPPNPSRLSPPTAWACRTGTPPTISPRATSAPVSATRSTRNPSSGRPTHPTNSDSTRPSPG